MKRGLIGQSLTQAFAIVLIFLLMVAFVVFSGFMSDNFSEELANSFLSDVVIFNDRLVSVEEAIGMFCEDRSLGAAINAPLKKSFNEEYGYNNYFALVYMGERAISWHVPLEVEQHINEDGTFKDKYEFMEFFDTDNEKVSIKRDNQCLYVLYARRGV